MDADNFTGQPVSRELDHDGLARLESFRAAQKGLIALAPAQGVASLEHGGGRQVAAALGGIDRAQPLTAKAGEQ